MASSKRQCPREADSSDLKGVRILVVEDAWHVAKAMKAMLEDLGMQVVGTAATIAEADRMVTAHMPEVAVVDINLKREMAYGLIDKLRGEGVPVIVVSGFAVLPRLAEKPIVILQKPFNGAELITALRQAVSSCRRADDT